MDILVDFPYDKTLENDSPNAGYLVDEKSVLLSGGTKTYVHQFQT